jgi:hypothetical protein
MLSSEGPGFANQDGFYSECRLIGTLTRHNLSREVFGPGQGEDSQHFLL